MDGIGSSLVGDYESCMDLFSEFKLPDIYETRRQFTVRPTNPINQNAPIRVLIGHSENRAFIPMNLIRGFIKFKIVEDDNTPFGIDMSPEDTGKVSIVNDIAHAIIESTNTKLMNVSISQHSRLNPWKAYLQRSHSYSPDVKGTNLTSEFYAEDDISTGIGVNEQCQGFRVRAEAIKESRVCTVAFTPQVDFFSSPKWLAPGHVLEIEFERAQPATYILTNHDKKKFKAVIIDFQLFVHHIMAKSAIMDGIFKKLRNAPVIYPITRIVMSTHTMYAGTSHFFLPELFRGKLPHALYFFFLTDSQHMGGFNNNPFALHHYGLSEIHLNRTGFPFPSEPLKFDFAKDDVALAYRWYLDNVGILDADMVASVGNEKYAKGYFMIPFDLSHTLNNSAVPHKAEEGHISATLRFEKALNHTLTIVTFATFHNVVTVDSLGEVFLDFAV